MASIGRKATSPADLAKRACAMFAQVAPRPRRGPREHALVAATEKARQAEAERIAGEKAALIGRIESKASERTKLAAELSAAVVAMDAAFRKLVDTGRELSSAWPLPRARVKVNLRRDGERIILRDLT